MPKFHTIYARQILFFFYILGPKTIEIWGREGQMTPFVSYTYEGEGGQRGERSWNKATD